MAKRKTKEADDDLPPELRDDYQPLADENAGSNEGAPAPQSRVQEIVQNLCTMPKDRDDRQTQRPNPTQWRTRVKLRPMVDFTAGDAIVESLDHFNKGGVGIRVRFPEGATNRPDAEERAIIFKHVKTQEGDKYEAGYEFDEHVKGAPKFWRKQVVPKGQTEDDIDPKVKAAIRANNDARARALAADLRDHYDLTHGHTDRVAKRRAEQEQSEHILD